MYTQNISNKIVLWVLFLIVTSLLFHPSAFATSIIMIRTQNDIVVGADSKGTNEYDELKKRLFCKIIQVGDIMFAASGLVEDKETGYSVNRVVAESANKGGTVDEIADRINTALVKPLNDALIHFKKISPEVYKKQIDGQKGITFQLLLFRFENGIPVVYKKNFGKPNLVHNTIPAIGTIVRCPGKECKGNRTLIALGSNSAIKDYLKKNLLPPTVDNGFLIKKLIMIQMKKTPQDVGLPIDLVRYDKMGIHWIQRKEVCQDLDQ